MFLTAEQSKESNASFQEEKEEKINEICSGFKIAYEMGREIYDVIPGTK